MERTAWPSYFDKLSMRARFSNLVLSLSKGEVGTMSSAGWQG